MSLGAAALVVVVAVALTRSSGDDGGASVTASDTAVVGGDLHSLVADPATPGRLYVGGHQAVARSDDGGRTWTDVGSLANADAMGWGFATNAIYVSGHPGLNRSDDGGRTFRRVNEGLPNTDVHAFGAGPSVLYGSSPAVGVFASTDGGGTWVERTGDAGQSFFGRVLVDAADGNRVRAADARTGVMESRDGGRTWNRVGLLPSAVWLSEINGVAVASGPAGAARTRDDGTWQVVELPAGAQLVEASAAESGVLYAAGLQGTQARVWVSRDNGQTWTRP